MALATAYWRGRTPGMPAVHLTLCPQLGQNEAEERTLCPQLGQRFSGPAAAADGMAAPQAPQKRAPGLAWRPQAGHSDA